MASCLNTKAPIIAELGNKHSVSNGEMYNAIQAWMNRGNDINDISKREDLEKFVKEYFNIDTSVVFENEEDFNNATYIFETINDTTYNSITEQKNVTDRYNKLIKALGANNVSKFKNREGWLQIKIAKPVKALNVNYEYSKDNLDFFYSQGYHRLYNFIRIFEEEDLPDVYNGLENVLASNNFNNIEGAFQATKLAFNSHFVDNHGQEFEELLEKFKNATPEEARKLGSQITNLDEENWNKWSKNIKDFLIKEFYIQKQEKNDPFNSAYRVLHSKLLDKVNIIDVHNTVDGGFQVITEIPGAINLTANISFNNDIKKWEVQVTPKKGKTLVDFEKQILEENTYVSEENVKKVVNHFIPKDLQEYLMSSKPEEDDREAFNFTDKLEKEGIISSKERVKKLNTSNIGSANVLRDRWGITFINEFTEETNALEQNVFNTEDIDNSRVDIQLSTNLGEHEGNTTLKIYLKNQHEKGHFELVKDREEGYYSVHLKTDKDKLEKGDTKILFEELSKAIPVGAKVSTWGSLSEDGIRALNENIGRGMVKVGERDATKKSDNSTIKIPIWEKVQATSNNKETTTKETKTDTSTSMLEKGAEKIKALKAISESSVVPDENFKNNHTYWRVDSKGNKIAKVEVSVTSILDDVNKSVKLSESEPPKKYAVPSQALGNDNDFIMRYVFKNRKAQSKKEIVENLAKNSTSIPNTHIEKLSETVDIIYDKLIPQFDKWFPEGWDCTTDEIPLIAKRTNNSGEEYYVAGTPDMILWTGKGDFYLVDFKTIRDILGKEKSNVKNGLDKELWVSDYKRNHKWFTQTSIYGSMITTMTRGEIKPNKNTIIIASDTDYPEYSNDNVFLDENGVIYRKAGDYNETIFNSNKYRTPQFHSAWIFGENRDGVEEMSDVLDLSFKSANTIEQLNDIPKEEKSKDLGDKNEKPNNVKLSAPVIKNTISQEALMQIPAAERQFLSNFIFHKTSTLISMLENGIFDSEKEPLLKLLVEKIGKDNLYTTDSEGNKKLKSRNGILKVGLNTTFNAIKEYYFNIDGYDSVDDNNVTFNVEIGSPVEEKLQIAYDNFEELCKAANSKFIFYEQITLEKGVELDTEVTYDVGDESLKNESSIEELETKTRENYQLHFSNVSAKASLSNAVKRFLGNIPIEVTDGKVVDNYGYCMDTYIDADLVVSKLQNWLCNAESLQEMIGILEKQSKGYPWVKPVIEMLTAEGNNPIRQQFFQNFRKDFTTYSTIYKEYDKNTGNYKYGINIINTKGAEQAILDVLQANFEMSLGQRILSANTSNIKWNTNEIEKCKQTLNKYNTSNAGNPFSRNAVPSNEVFNDLYKSLVSLGLPEYVVTYKNFTDVYKKMVNTKGLSRANSMMIEIASTASNILNSVVNINEGPFDPLDSKVSSYYYKIIRGLAEYMDDAIESSTYENGKMYYSYCNPSYMGKMIRNLKDASATYSGNPEDFADSKFGQFIIENFGKYKFFNTGKEDEKYVYDDDDMHYTRLYRTEWIDTLVHNAKAREILAHKVQLTFDKNTYTDLDELQETISLMLEYRNGGDNNVGWFRVPMLANKPSNEFIRFFKKTSVEMQSLDYAIDVVENNEGKPVNVTSIKKYKQEILDGLWGTFQQELMRMRSVLERGLKQELEKDNIKNFDISSKTKSLLRKDLTLENIKEEDLKLLIKDNGKNPNGAIFKFLTVFNDVINTENKTPEQNAITSYILDKLKGVDTNENDAQKIFMKITNMWINKNFNEAKAEWKKLGVFDTNKDREGKDTGINKNFGIDNNSVESEVENFFWNDMYAAINIIQMTVTDLSFNKNVEDFQKRFAQVHAPALKFDDYAEWNGIRVAETERGKGVKAYQRTLILKDSEVISDIKKNVEEIFNNLDRSNTGKYESLKNSILNSLDSVNVADAQGLTCPTAYRKKMIMMGEWNDDMEKAYNKIRSKDFTYEDILPLMLQPLKPFVYTKINKKMGIDTLDTMPIPVQNKNSEYMLFVAGVMAQSGRLKDSKIAALYDFMEDSAYDHNKYNGIGIDTIQFESAVKSGLQGKVDINDEAIKKLQAEYLEKHGKKLSVYDATKKILENAAYYNEDTATIKGNTGNSNGRYDMTYVHEIPFEDYGIQQNVPAHFQDHSQAIGSQIRILNVSDLNGEYEIMLNKRKQLVDASEIRKEYFRLSAENIRLTVEQLQKDFLLSSDVRKNEVEKKINGYLWSNRDNLSREGLSKVLDNLAEDYLITDSMKETMLNNFTKNSKDFKGITRGVNFEISKDERTQVLHKLIEEEAMKDSKYGYDMIKSISLNNVNGNLEFNVPLCDSVQTVRIQQMLNSIIKSRINKQKFKGGPVVQASVFGQSEGLDIIFNKKGGIQHFQVFITCPSESLEKLLVKKAREDKKNDYYYLDNPEEAVEKKYIPEDILNLIGYRIPTEDKYSMQPCRVKSFLPRNAGEVVMLPKEITWMSGSDFDIDKLYVEAKAYDFVDGEFKSPREQYDKNCNSIFDIQWEILTNSDTMPKMFNPGNFDMQKESVRRLEILEAVNSGALDIKKINIEGVNKENLWDKIEKLPLKKLDDIIASNNINNRNIIFASTQTYFHKQNMTAGKLIGIFANNNTSHSFVNIHNQDTENKISVTFPKRESFTINGINYSDKVELDASLSNDGTTYISKVIASYLAASVDAVKDPVLNKMNLNTLTTGPAMLLTRMGVDANTVGLFFRQPIIMYVTREYFKANSEKFTKIEDVIDSVCKKLGNKVISNSRNCVVSNNDLSKNIGKEIDNSKEDVLGDITHSNEVLSIFKTLCTASQELNDLTFCTKFNSMTNVAGPKISDTKVTVQRVLNFIDKCHSKSSIFGINASHIIDDNPILSEFFKVLYNPVWSNGVVQDESVAFKMFKEYFPHYSSTVESGLYLINSSLPDGVKMNNELVDKFIDFMSVYRMVKNGVFKIDKSKYNYYTTQDASGFISKVRNFKDKKWLTENGLSYLQDNKVINMLDITPSNKKCNKVTINASGGGLSFEQQDEIRTAWSSLIESNNKNVRLFGAELAEYFMLRGGFGFNPKTIMHLMPASVKMSIKGYTDIMGGKSVFSDSESWEVDDINDMVRQFVRNAANIRKLSYRLMPKVAEKAEGVKVKGNTLTIDKESSTFKSIGGEVLWFEYDNNKVAFLDSDKSNSTECTYTLVSKLGIGNNFIEILDNAEDKSFFNDNEGIIYNATYSYDDNGENDEIPEEYAVIEGKEEINKKSDTITQLSKNLGTENKQDAVDKIQKEQNKC